jgi:hypothetical protein
MASRTPYAEYLKAFAIARTGGSIVRDDLNAAGLIPADEQTHIAIALGAYDGRLTSMPGPNSRADFTAEMNSRLK